MAQPAWFFATRPGSRSAYDTAAFKLYELGRATPSRDMILRLSGTMDIPLRQQNALLLAAGLAPVWRERDLSAPDLAMVNTALDYMLRQHEPYPAFVVDRRWNLLRANNGAVGLTEFLLGPSPDVPSAEPANLAIALMSAEGLRPFLTNWEEVAHYFLRGVQADAQADGAAETLALLNRLLALSDVAALTERLTIGRYTGACAADAFSKRRQAAQHVHDDR